jgi:hypothetical protein
LRSAARRLPALLVLLGVAVLFVAGSPAAKTPHDVLITDDHGGDTYVRADGEPSAITDLCGSSRQPQEEPSVAVDPTDPEVIAVGANDACGTRFGDLWVGYYRSEDGGKSWSRSLVPGFAHDTSSDGIASPVHGACEGASDPALSFDAHGTLYFGFLCFGFRKFERGSIYVARYDDHGARYVETVPVRRSGSSGFEDKPALAIDTTGGGRDGTVYAAWTDFATFRGRVEFCEAVFFARSTDGRAFVTATPISGRVCAHFADVAVGPDGGVFVTFRNATKVWITSSTDGGETFSRPRALANINPFEAQDFLVTEIDCGDGPHECLTHATFPRFDTNPTVVADENGVHVAYAAQDPVGRGRVYVKTSPDGSSWPDTSVQVHRRGDGHQWMADVATDGRHLDVVYLDSRDDPAFAPRHVPGETGDGRNPGNVVQTWLARSSDGGRTWLEQRLSAAGSNPNWEVQDAARVPFYGDYLSVSAVPGHGFAAWPDSRDLVPGTDSRESGAADDGDGFDGYLPCAWSPNDIHARRYSLGITTCLTEGGLDLNVYGATFDP